MATIWMYHQHRPTRFFFYFFFPASPPDISALQLSLSRRSAGPVFSASKAGVQQVKARLLRSQEPTEGQSGRQKYICSIVLE